MYNLCVTEQDTSSTIEETTNTVSAAEVISSENFTGPVGETLGLFEEGSYRDGFIEANTVEEQQVLKKLESTVVKKVVASVTDSCQEVARKELSQEAGEELSLQDARKLGKKFGEAMVRVKKEGIDGVSFQDAVEAGLEEGRGKEEYIEASAHAAALLESAQKQQLQILREVYGDLAERSEDADLVEAFDSWGRSPNSRSDRGPDGQGYNAGLIHYFEYRGDTTKNGRFKVEEQPFNVDGFIEYSGRMKGLIDGEGDVAARRRFRDSSGQERVVVLAENGDLVIGFKRADESEPKIISALPGQKMDAFSKRGDKVQLEGGSDYLNHLTEGIVEITDS